MYRGGASDGQPEGRMVVRSGSFRDVPIVRTREEGLVRCESVGTDEEPERSLFMRVVIVS